MGVDVVDGVDVQPGIGQRPAHGPRRSASLLVRLCDMTCVAAGAVAFEFTVDSGPAPPGMLQFLKHHHPGPLGEHKSVALGIKRPTGPLRRVDALGKRPHILEAGQSHRCQGRFTAAGDHDVGVVILDRPQRVPHGVGSTGAGGGHSEIRSLDPMHRRNVATG